MMIKDKKIQQIYCYFMENTFGDFQKLILKTSKKKKKNHFTTNISIYTSHRHFEVLCSFILYIL